MEKKLYEQLLASAREAQDIAKGKAKPSRSFTYQPKDIAHIRRKLNLSQDDFATLIQVPTATFRNWEQGRTFPDAPAQTLLLIADKKPQVFHEIAGAYGILYKSSKPDGRVSSFRKSGRIKLKKTAKRKK